jgi:hypothetical protein
MKDNLDYDKERADREEAAYHARVHIVFAVICGAVLVATIFNIGHF